MALSTQSYLSIVAVCLLIASCAQVRTPSGGTRDEVPPQVIFSSPQNMSTHFDGSQIIIAFDEYVQLNNPREQLLISPPLRKDPEVKLKNSRILTIDFGAEPLATNTTYTINLGAAIKDNNEGNILQDNVFLFSTGSFLDSLSIRGQALSARYEEPLSQVTMLAFLAGSDSIALGKRPRYVTRCDASGKFLFEHMAAGAYELIALLDKDKDLKVDKNEAFGFLLESVLAGTDSASEQVIRVGDLAPDGNTLKRGEWAKDGRSVLITSDGSMDSLIFQWPFENSPVHIESWDRKDSARYWFERPVVQGDIAIISSSEGKVDTLRVGRVSDTKESWSGGKPELTYAQDTLRMAFDRPISQIDSTKILLIEDSLEIPYLVIGSNPMLIEMIADWQYGYRYNLLLNKGALTDIYASLSDSVLWPISIPQETSLGHLNLKVEIDPGNYLVYLLTKDKKVVHQTQAKEGFTWKLPPMSAGEFWLWVVEDRDGNEEWTPGSYTGRRLPERVYYRPESIKLRANWEMDLTVNPIFK